MVTTNNVISQLNIKRGTLGDEYDTYYIGPELKYIGSLATSNNHNLEEQMIMGVDRKITSYYDSANRAQIEIIDFCRDGDTKYYSLKKTIYDDEYGIGTAQVQGNILNFNSSNIEISEGHILNQIDYDPNMTYINKKFDITSDSIIEEDILYYVDPDDTTYYPNGRPISIKSIKRIVKNGRTTIVETVKEPS